MQTTTKLLIAIGLSPLIMWGCFALLEQWTWLGADPNADSGRGCSAFLIYFVLLPAAIMASAALGLAGVWVHDYLRRPTGDDLQ